MGSNRRKGERENERETGYQGSATLDVTAWLAAKAAALADWPASGAQGKSGR